EQAPDAPARQVLVRHAEGVAHGGAEKHSRELIGVVVHHGAAHFGIWRWRKVSPASSRCSYVGPAPVTTTGASSPSRPTMRSGVAGDNTGSARPSSSFKRLCHDSCGAADGASVTLR